MYVVLISHELSDFVFARESYTVGCLFPEGLCLVADKTVLEMHLLDGRRFGFILILHKDVRVELEIEELELFQETTVCEELALEDRLRIRRDLRFQKRLLLKFEY